MWQLTLIVFAVILLGAALYVFADERGILKAESKKNEKNEQKA